MTRYWTLGAILLATVLAMLPRFASAQEFSATLSGFKEVGELNNESGAILSGGEARLKVFLDKDSQTLRYELTYSGLSSAATQAHIHFGKRHVPGGVMVFLCTNLGNNPLAPACPANGGTVTGTITAANVVAIPGENVPAGDFAAVEAAILSHTSYVNIHTTNFPGGEIRGELNPERR